MFSIFKIFIIFIIFLLNYSSNLLCIKDPFYIEEEIQNKKINLKGILIDDDQKFILLYIKNKSYVVTKDDLVEKEWLIFKIEKNHIEIKNIKNNNVMKLFLE